MKTFRLLIVALLVAGSASAQRYERKAMRGEYSPTVYLISVQEGLGYQGHYLKYVDAQDGKC